jgi:hypothetical protein
LEGASHKKLISTLKPYRNNTLQRKKIEGRFNLVSKFAKNNQITMQKARSFLTSGELAEFKWMLKNSSSMDRMN